MRGTIGANHKFILSLLYFEFTSFWGEKMRKTIRDGLIYMILTNNYISAHNYLQTYKIILKWK